MESSPLSPQVVSPTMSPPANVVCGPFGRVAQQTVQFADRAGQRLEGPVNGVVNGCASLVENYRMNYHDQYVVPSMARVGTAAGPVVEAVSQIPQHPVVQQYVTKPVDQYLIQPVQTWSQRT
jgi:hypothetical protein